MNYIKDSKQANQTQEVEKAQRQKRKKVPTHADPDFIDLGLRRGKFVKSNTDNVQYIYTKQRDNSKTLSGVWDSLLVNYMKETKLDQNRLKVENTEPESPVLLWSGSGTKKMKDEIPPVIILNLYTKRWQQNNWRNSRWPSLRNIWIALAGQLGQSGQQ